MIADFCRRSHNDSDLADITLEGQKGVLPGVSLAS